MNAALGFRFFFFAAAMRFPPSGVKNFSTL
jgi:hypothetical protein